MFSRSATLLALLIVCSGCGHPPTADNGESIHIEQRVRVLIARINDHPDQNHFDFTPATDELIEVGTPAIPYVVELMLVDDRDTRLRAMHVLYYIILNRYGWVSGKGWPDETGERKVDRLWSDLGDLDWQAPLEKRQASVMLWRRWVAAGCPMQ